MKLKVGDKIYCHTAPKFANGGSTITKNKWYTITGWWNHTHISIINDYYYTSNYPLYCFSEYFYTKQECRKLKLKKLYT